MFTERPIYRLIGNKVEILNVSSIKRSLDNIIYESNPRNADFDDLPFDGDERLIVIQRLYRINDDISFMYINGSIFYV